MIPIKRVFVLLFGLIILQSCKDTEQKQMPVVDVPYIEVQQEDVPVYQEFVGQTFGASDIGLKSRVNGWVTGIHFQEGSLVKKGQLLYSVDPQQYQTKVDQATGQYAAAVANLANAEANLKRIRPLAQSNAVSKRELDAAVAAYDAAKAQVDANQANVSNQKIELGYTKIYSPLDGIIGISEVRVGDYVSGTGSQLLATVSKTTTVRVRFSMSETEYLRIQRILKANPEAIKKSIETEMILSDGSTYNEKGTINFADRQIDPLTGTITIEASFPNTDGLLRPGQFVRVKMVIERKKDAFIVPQRAVLDMQGIYQVVKIDKSNKIEMAVVNAGIQTGRFWVIDSGVSKGERLALIGNIFIKNGMTVKPVPANWPDKKQEGK
jgi:membrane fusion protein (multidrug efflux system)